MDCDDGGVGCVSGAAQPERIVNANPTAGFARRLSNLLARSSQFRGVQHCIQQDVAPGGQVPRVWRLRSRDTHGVLGLLALGAERLGRRIG